MATHNYNTTLVTKKRLIQIFVILLVFYSIWSFNTALNPNPNNSNNYNPTNNYKENTSSFNNGKYKPISKKTSTETPKVIEYSDEKQEEEYHKTHEKIDIIDDNNTKNTNENTDKTDDNNKDNLKNGKYDIGISVLGFKLYEDGMPTKILKDRVTLAAEHYGELKLQGFNPILLLSGKGKGTVQIDSAYDSEADAMFSLLIAQGVSKQDIHLDSESTNTAENAKNTLTLFSQYGIKRLIVVTSDFHVLRTQYIFQTVMPSSIEIEFYGSPTSPQIRKSNEGTERSLFKSSQNDLDKLKLLETPNEKSWGYHPIRNLPRWRMIEREIEYDTNHFRNIEKGSFMVDYGSNEGYFSIHLSQKVKGGTVVSLEGEAVKEYNSAAQHHEQKIQDLNITNNYLCRTTIQTSMFEQLNSNSHVYEYQLCLSVFHWFGMKDRDSFEKVLYNQLMNAKTTFLELPEAMTYVGRERQHAWDSVNTWYGGRTEIEILTQLKEKFNMKMTWKVLGALMHDNETVRKVIRIDVRGLNNSEDSRKPLDLDSIKEIYSCGKLMHP